MLRKRQPILEGQLSKARSSMLNSLATKMMLMEETSTELVLKLVNSIGFLKVTMSRP